MQPIAKIKNFTICYCGNNFIVKVNFQVAIKCCTTNSIIIIYMIYENFKSAWNISLDYDWKSKSFSCAVLQHKITTHHRHEHTWGKKYNNTFSNLYTGLQSHLRTCTSIMLIYHGLHQSIYVLAPQSCQYIMDFINQSTQHCILVYKAIYVLASQSFQYIMDFINQSTQHWNFRWTTRLPVILASHQR